MTGCCRANRCVSEIQIRAAEPGDAEAMYEIMRGPTVVANTLQLPWRPLELQRERLQNQPGVHRLVALIDGQVVGNLSLHQNQGPRRRDVATFGMVVHEAFHNRGIGSALMAAMIELADGWLGIRRIEMEVWTDNLAAIHLYEKFGFVKEGTARQFAHRSGKLVDAFFMARIKP
jgi:putative acetyltransferase